MSLQSTVCVKFTPKQYMKLYECGLLYFDNKKLDTTAAVLTSLVNNTLIKWLVPPDQFQYTITSGPNTPTIEECKLM